MKYSQKLRSKRPAILAAGIATLFIALSGAPSPAAVTYVGRAIIDGTQTDQSGLPATILQDGASRQNALNGFGSGLTYAGGNLFYLLCDRGPNKVAYAGGAPVDNTQTYDNRVQQFNLTFTPVGSLDGNGHYSSYTVGASNIGTTLLKNANGAQYVGISTGWRDGTRLDPEGVRVAPDGTFWISDEYGPFLLHFNRAGQQIGSLALPPGFVIGTPADKGSDELSQTLGRVNNKGMEGVAISPDGKTLVGIMQSPLLQDGGVSGTNSAGLNVRMVVYDLTNPTAAPKQYLYPLDSTAFANSEILAVNNHKFLIDERDATAGSGQKLLYMVDFNQPTPPTDLATTQYNGSTTSNGLPASGIPAGVVPLTKTLFANVGALVTPGLTTDSTNFRTDLPDKFEGYSWGPDLPDGRHLLVTNDNDYSLPFTAPGGSITGKNFPNYIFALAVDPSDVPDFQPQVFDTDAVNNIDHIVVIYQENWPFDGLYGSFPGANGLANASGASVNQINRLTGAALSGDGATSYNNPAFVPNAGQPATDQVKNPPVPLTTDANSGVADTRVPSNLNTLAPYALASFIDPTLTTGDIYHRYWQEQFQIFGTVTVPNNPDAEAGNNSGFVTWSDNPGLVMSHYDATNLPEGLLAQQYTICDNFFHSAFGGSFLNHQFLVAAQAPVYDQMPTSNNVNIAYLDADGVFVMNTSGMANGKFARDGSITPVVGDVLSGVSLNGTSTTITVGSGANPGFAEAYAGPSGTTFDKHYVVNTTRSVNLGGNGENGLPGNGSAPLVSLLPSAKRQQPDQRQWRYTALHPDDRRHAQRGRCFLEMVFRWLAADPRL
ncbi:MAG: esterase-like activity of phytase family protein [Chthoniobacter sp.]